MSRTRWIAVAILIGVVVICFGFGDGWSDAERRVLVAAGSFGENHARAALAATALGYFVVLAPLSLALAAWLARLRGSAIAIVYLSGTLVTRLIVEIVKLIARRPRPALLPHLAPVTSWSFPSAHAANSMMVLLGFALLASISPTPPVRVERRWEGWAIAGSLLLSAAIGASRILLAVHWPSDVIAGWAIGAAAALLTAVAANRISRARS